jgi:hypothetical protein
VIGGKAVIRKKSDWWLVIGILNHQFAILNWYTRNLKPEKIPVTGFLAFDIKISPDV